MFPPLSANPLASTNPKPVISRITLITAILAAPASFKTTVLAVFSSAASAAGAAATATADGSTPNYSFIASNNYLN